ncbi:MAG: cytochrome c [Anaerolineales bacterium]|nr:cytochrome c [Anaerolineales bacterium]
MSLSKRLLFMGIVAAALLGLLVFFTYDVIKIDWLSFMEVQASYRPMENPLPVPARSIPVEGAAYVPGMGAPVNPVDADDISAARGAQLFSIHCAICHGVEGRGDGVIAPYLQNIKPANLSSSATQTKSDGALFLVISSGVAQAMPPMNENLDVRERWDVVNFLRTLAVEE